MHLLAGLSVGVSAGVAVIAAGAAAVVDLLGRGAHIPVGHALGLVAVAVVAALAAVALLLDHLLLGPDDVAAAVVPGALGRVRGRVALGLLVGGRDADAGGAEALDREAHLGADRRRLALARLLPNQGRHRAVPALGAVLLARRDLPRVVLRLSADEEVVPPALADAPALPRVRDLVRLDVGARAVGVRTAVVGVGVVAVLHVAAGLELGFGGSRGSSDGQGHQEDGVEGVGQHFERGCIPRRKE
ncbi:hypothetical protein PG984_004058 [Apiospora sp. TS-2023a]